MASNTLFFIDFDGVICDSVLECFVSSWLAYNTLNGRKMPESVPVNYLQRFRSLRPYIRTGRDYVLLQALIENGEMIQDQSDFDRRLEFVGETELERYHAEFYRARQQLLNNDRQYWLGLHVLYPGIGNALSDVAAKPDFYILSTKQAPFILEILTSHKILWPMERILDSGKRVKGEVISEIMQRKHTDSAVFVDDQVDHLQAINSTRIKTYLAEWGYVRQSRCSSEKAVQMISIDAFIQILSRS